MMAMKTQYGSFSRTRQKGTALMVALIILIGITLLSLAGVNTSILELRMARNTEATADTHQVAMAALDYVVGDESHLPTTGALNTPHDCDDASANVIALPTDNVFSCSDGDCNNNSGEEICATAARVADCAPPPRARLASSLTSYSAFNYEAQVDVDKNETGNGRTNMVLGYILLGPKC